MAERAKAHSYADHAHIDSLPHTQQTACTPSGETNKSRENLHYIEFEQHV